MYLAAKSVGSPFEPALFLVSAIRQEVKLINKNTDRRNQGLVNDDIRAREVMVIGDGGEQLGVMTKREALEIADERQLDLVLVAPNAKPPVAKFMDYNKFKYDQQKKLREAKKKQKIVSLKEIRLSPKIDTHDFETKLRNGRKFLEKGDKLKISIRFRGREMAHTNLGRTVMLDFSKRCEDLADIESHPKQEGRTMIMTLTPKKDK
ncbi:MAG: translation initiation factor IF-3 [Acholeplasmatales bacterium]|nr:MAG: translation initiation factor IF-3 [Acholeplasmatales bacterium]